MLLAKRHIYRSALNPVNAFKSFPTSKGITGGAIGIGSEISRIFAHERR